MRRSERVAKAYREGEPLPHIDYGRAIGGRTVFPLRAWTDASGRVYVALAGHGGKLFAASFSRRDLRRLLRVRGTRSVRLSYDPTIPTRTLLDFLTRNLIPSGWFKDRGKNE